MRVGVNTFGLRRELAKDYENTLKTLKKAGVTSIEPCIEFRRGSKVPTVVKIVLRKMGLLGGMFPEEKAGEKIDDLRSMGFDVYSIHLWEVKFELKYLQRAVEFMKKNNIRYAVYSFMESSVDVIKKKTETIREALKLFEENDVFLLIHNHTEEWKEDKGTCVMEYLLDTFPKLNMELDTGWTEYASVNTVNIMEKYASQIPLLHIKDIGKGAAAGGSNRDSFCVAAGEGILPLKEVMLESVKMPWNPQQAYIIDQDNSIDGDILEDIRIGILNMERVLQEK